MGGDEPKLLRLNIYTAALKHPSLRDPPRQVKAAAIKGCGARVRASGFQRHPEHTLAMPLSGRRTQLGADGGGSVPGMRHTHEGSASPDLVVLLTRL